AHLAPLDGVDEEIGDGSAASPSEKLSRLPGNPFRGEPAMGGEPSVVISYPPVVGGQVPELPESLQADAIPRIAPPEQVEGQIGPREGRGRQVRHDSRRLDHDGISRLAQLETEVEALRAAQKARLPKVELVEGLAPKELAVELDQLGGLAPKLGAHLAEE